MCQRPESALDGVLYLAHRTVAHRYRVVLADHQIHLHRPQVRRGVFVAAFAARLDRDEDPAFEGIHLRHPQWCHTVLHRDRPEPELRQSGCRAPPPGVSGGRYTRRTTHTSAPPRALRARAPAHPRRAGSGGAGSPPPPGPPEACCPSGPRHPSAPTPPDSLGPCEACLLSDMAVSVSNTGDSMDPANGNLAKERTDGGSRGDRLPPARLRRLSPGDGVSISQRRRVHRQGHPQRP
jgi:hypothetical protein